jgi:hypothetical protein
VLEQHVAQDRGDWDVAACVVGLRFDLFAVDTIPPGPNVDHAGREIHVVPLERLQLVDPFAKWQWLALVYLRQQAR